MWREAFRRTGADLPGGDPRPTHGAEMEGWFWRCTDVATRRVVVALCGVNRGPQGDWATVAVATHPGGVRSVAAPVATASSTHFRVDVPGVLHATADHLHVALDDVRVDLDLREVTPWPFRTGGGGIFSVVPFLGQYWHPHLLDGRASGEVQVGAERWSLDDAPAYAEKNWGRGFPAFWWWGQAQGFDRHDVSVAFTGGVLDAGPFATVVGGIAVAVGGRVRRLTPPLARVHAEVGGGRWRVDGRSRGTRITIDGDGALEDAHVLPVPAPAEGRNHDADFELLAGSLHLRVEQDGRCEFEGTSTLAGLEVGFRPGSPALATSPPTATIRSAGFPVRRARAAVPR